jgi:sulfite reductase alpha subunit-like flavoprotein
MEVKIGFEDFVDLSDSMAPRLFTIASSYKKQKNVFVMASIV